MYSELLEEFGGQRVAEFKNAADWAGTDVAYRLRVDYDDQTSTGDLLAALLSQPESNKLRGLIIGAWTEACTGTSAAAAIAAVAQAAPRLPELQSLFLGEMTYEESEISWINQADVSPVLTSYPRLERLRIRGGTQLAISKVRHESLRELAIETGGLPRSVLRELFQCELPTLERLELLLGEEQYGFDGGVEDLQPLLTGKLFPSLKYLGLMNSAIANEIAAVVANSPVVARLEVLDLSLGNLDDEGVRSLLALKEFPNLKLLNLSHHYASEEVIDELTAALSSDVVANDPQSPEDEWRPIVHAE